MYLFNSGWLRDCCRDTISPLLAGEAVRELEEVEPRILADDVKEEKVSHFDAFDRRQRNVDA